MPMINFSESAIQKTGASFWSMYPAIWHWFFWHKILALVRKVFSWLPESGHILGFRSYATAMRSRLTGRWILWWRRRFPDCEKAAGQTSQRYGRQPVWTLSCFVRVELSEKARPQWPHTYGRTPECVRMWVLKDELWVNRRRQTLIGQANGRSPATIYRVCQ